MKKIVLLMFTLATLSTSLFAGFGTSGNEKVKKLKGTDGKKYEFLIGTASEEGSYYSAGQKLAKLLGKTKKGKQAARAETTDGCGQNLELLDEGIVNIIFCQGDMAALRKAQDKNYFSNKLTMRIDRPEHVQLIMRKGMNEDDLQESGAKVLTGLINSGGNGSWDNIVKLEQSYGKATVINGDIDDSALQDLEDGTIDAIVRTSYLNPKTDQLAKDIANNKKLYFADFDDKDLNDSIDLGNGSRPIYEFENREVAKGFFNDVEADVLRTNVYIIINKDLMTKKQRNKVIRIIKNKKLFWDTGSNSSSQRASKEDVNMQTSNSGSVENNNYTSEVASFVAGAVVGNMLSSDKKKSYKTKAQKNKIKKKVKKSKRK